MFEAGCDIHNGGEVVEHVAGSDCDAWSGMKSELQHDGSCIRASAPGRRACMAPLSVTNENLAPIAENDA